MPIKRIESIPFGEVCVQCGCKIRPGDPCYEISDNMGEFDYYCEDCYEEMAEDEDDPSVL